MKRLYLPLVAAAACLVLIAAQNPDPPAVIQIIRESIKEGRGPAHEKVETDYARAFRKNKFPFYYLALTSMTGPGEVWFVNAYPSFAAVEQAEKEYQKAGIKGEIDLLDARDGELRSGSRSMYAIYRKDLSYRPDLASVSKSRYFTIQSFRLKLGRMGDFMAGSKAINDSQTKADLKVPAIAYQVVAGAPEGLFLFLSPMESLKTMDEFPSMEKAMADAMGAEKFQDLMKSTGDVFTTVETSFFSVSPKMSYVSKQTEDGDPAFWRPKVAVKPVPKSKPVEKSGQ